jgi:hypothetical protein
MINAICEHTCELAAHLRYIENAQLVSRRVTEDGNVLCVQRWRVRADVPQLLRPHLEDTLLDWTLSFERRMEGAHCRWQAESDAAQISGTCDGTLNFFDAAGCRGTQIELQCNFASTNQGLRTIVGALLANHWRRVAVAGVRWIAANQRAG